LYVKYKALKKIDLTFSIRYIIKKGLRITQIIYIMSMCDNTEKISVGKFYNFERYYKTCSDKTISPLKFALDKCTETTSHTFMIQDKKTKYRSYVNIPYNKLEKIWINDECISEIIRTDKPLKMFFDLDIIEKDEDKDFYNDKYIIETLLETINGLEIQEKPIKSEEVVYSKCRGYCEKKKAIKLSYHIIICNSVFFKNIEDYKRFTLSLKSILMEQTSILYDMIDWCMGSKNQVFKLPYQSKAGESNIDRIQKPFNKEWTVLDFMVSNVSTNTNYTFYDVRELEDPKELKQGKACLTAHRLDKKIIVSKTLNDILINYKSDIEYNERKKDIFKDIIEPLIKDLEYGSIEYYLNSIPNRPYVAYDMFIIIGMICKRISTQHLKNPLYGLKLWTDWTSHYGVPNASSLEKQYNSFTSDRGYGFPVLANIAKIFNPKVGCGGQMIEPLFRFDKDKTADIIEVNTKHLGTEIDIIDIKNKYDVLYVKSPMASGKSYMLRKIYEKEPEASVCLISCKRSFACAMTAELTKYDFVNYMDIEYKNSITNYDRIICSVESLRYCRQQYDYLLIDESESIATNLIGGMNMKQDPINNILKFYDMVNNSKKVFVMDAYLCNRSKDMINDILKSHRKTIYIKNNYKPDRRFIHKTNQRLMTESINYNIKKGKEVVFVVNSLSKQMSMLDEISVKAEDCLIYNKHQKLDNSLDVNKEWKDKKFLSYTPTLTAGISYDKAPKDNLYMYLLNKGSCLLRDSIQAFKRVRKFTNNNIEYFAFKMPTDGELPLTLSEVKTCEENYVQSLNRTMPWLTTASADPRLKYIVNLIIFCRLEENLNEVYFYQIFHKFMECENISIVKNNVKGVKIESTYSEDLVFDYEKCDLIDDERYAELDMLKEESGMLSDVKDYEEYTKYKYIENYVDRTLKPTEIRDTFNRLGEADISSCYYNNIRFKKFMKDVRLDLLKEEFPLNKDEVKTTYQDLLMERITKFTKASDCTEMTEKYLSKYYFISMYLKNLGFIKKEGIDWDNQYYTQDYGNMKECLKTISYRSFSLLFNDRNLRLTNIKDDKLDNITNKQMHSIFNNLLKEELGLYVVSCGRKKIKGKENKLYELKASIGSDILRGKEGVFFQKVLRNFYIDNINYNDIKLEEEKTKKKVVKFKIKRKSKTK